VKLLFAKCRGVKIERIYNLPRELREDLGPCILGHENSLYEALAMWENINK
jgi:hypothetical protein